jgi:hypothetical protein
MGCVVRPEPVQDRFYLDRSYSKHAVASTSSNGPRGAELASNRIYPGSLIPLVTWSQFLPKLPYSCIQSNSKSEDWGTHYIRFLHHLIHTA